MTNSYSKFYETQDAKWKRWLNDWGKNGLMGKKPSRDQVIQMLKNSGCGVMLNKKTNALNKNFKSSHKKYMSKIEYCQGYLTRESEI